MGRENLETATGGEVTIQPSLVRIGNIAIGGYSTEEELKDFAKEVFLSTHFITYEALFLLAKDYPIEKVAQRCGMDEAKLSSYIERLYGKLEVNEPTAALEILEALARLSYPDSLDSFDPSSEVLGPQLEDLSNAEKDVLGCVCLGMSNAQIAEQCSITVQTVKFHLSSIYSKLGVANRTEAMRVGFNGGLLTWARDTEQTYRGQPAMIFTRQAMEALEAEPTKA